MTQTYEPAHDSRTDALEPPSPPEQAVMANDKPSNTNRITVTLAMHALRRPASCSCAKVTSDITEPGLKNAAQSASVLGETLMLFWFAAGAALETHQVESSLLEPRTCSAHRVPNG
jgi:hypothetical protein